MARPTGGPFHLLAVVTGLDAVLHPVPGLLEVRGHLATVGKGRVCGHGLQLVDEVCEGHSCTDVEGRVLDGGELRDASHVNVGSEGAVVENP